MKRGHVERRSVVEFYYLRTCMCELISYSFLLLEVQPMTKEDSLVRMYRMFFQCSSFIQAQTIYIMRNVVKSLL